MANPRRIFKIGMFVKVAFGTLGTAKKTTPTISKDAVQVRNNQQVVFVTTEKPTEFIVRPIRVATETNGLYPVLEGLSVGERVVTSGSFMLRAEWMKTHTAR